MKHIESYNNICISLDMATDQLERYIDERNRLVRLMDSRKPKQISGQAYSDMPGGCRDDTPLNEIVRAIQKLDNHIELWQAQVDFYSKSKLQIENALETLNGVEYKVFLLNRVKDLPLGEVAEILDYSYDRIRHINAKINRNISTIEAQTP